MNATDLESLCAGWPGVASSVKWEDDLVFTVAGKMFAVYCLRGPHRERVSFKVDPQRFLELTDQPGIAPAAMPTTSCAPVCRRSSRRHSPRRKPRQFR